MQLKTILQPIQENLDKFQDLKKMIEERTIVTLYSNTILQINLKKKIFFFYIEVN